MKKSTNSDALMLRFYTEINELYGSEVRATIEKAVVQWQALNGPIANLNLEQLESLKNDIVQKNVEHFAIAASTIDAPFASD